MKKLRRISACLFALVMVFTLLASSLVNVYAVGIPPDPVASETEEADPESTSGETPDSSLPPDDSDTPPDDSSAPPDDSSVPPEDNSDPSDGSDAEEPDDTSEEPEAPAEEEPAFVPLEIVGFIPELTAEFGQEVELRAGLNRDDVAVSYQWEKRQIVEDEEEPETLFDYDEGLSTDYWFPYADITEADLLAMDPYATWPGIELYMAALEAADGDHTAVNIENGAENTAIEEEASVLASEVLIPEEAEWLPIEGATQSTYAFVFAEENLDAEYRCVITIIDEAYIAMAKDALLADDASGDDAEPPEEDAVEPEDDEHASIVETELVTDTVSIVPPLAITPMVTSTKPKVSLENGFIVGVGEGMEYITADTLNSDRATIGAPYNLNWTSLAGTGVDNLSKREDGTPYLNPAMYIGPIYDDKTGLPKKDDSGNEIKVSRLYVLSAWYGKTVYFRNIGAGDTEQELTAVEIPAYTGIDYTTGQKTLYKDNVSVLNVYVPETKYNFYEGVLDGTNYDDYSLINNVESSIVYTNAPLTPHVYPGHSFNENAEFYLKDAEGNYRYDSVIVGVNVGAEPDISGAAAWALRDYVAEGYGFITGHDMLYAYGGVTDASYVPDRNDTETPMYHMNTNIEGHFNMNWLMGVNKQYKDAHPREAETMVLAAGDYRDKTTLYGGGEDGDVTSTLRMITHTGAPASVKDRNPTNYPYNESRSGVDFYKDATIRSHSTHSNQQIAYGTIWINFAKNPLAELGLGVEVLDDKRHDGYEGTNNFYLTTNGNLALDQIGHIILPSDKPGRPTIYYDEARILANTIMYVSQRQQCQICQSGQNGSTEAHFVHKIYDYEDLKKIGDPDHWFTHPLDGCYMLAADIQLLPGWEPIENFSGHFHADNYGSVNGQLTNYRVTLNAEGTPLFANDTADGAGGWNLGTDPEQGVPEISGADGPRTTAVARVSGQLNLLLGDQPQKWANCIVVIKGTDGKDYWARTNNEGKYVIANLPCTGIMDARVYRTRTYTPDMDATGTGVSQNGTMRVNVQSGFWETNDTTSIYIKEFKAIPIKDVTVYDGEDALMVNGGITYETKVTDVTWQVRLAGTSNWINISASGLDYEIIAPVFHSAGEDSWTEVGLKIKDACIVDSGLNVRAVFRTPSGVTRNTYSDGFTGSLGMLTVNHWPMKITHPEAVTVWVDGTATFNSAVEARGGIDSGLSVQWQIRQWSVDPWKNIEELDDGITWTEVSASAGTATGNAQYPVKTTSTLKIFNTPETIDEWYVRAVYTYNHGGKHAAHAGYTEASADEAAMITVINPKLGILWADDQESRIGMSFENPLMVNSGSELSSDVAVYEADVIYLPGADITSQGSPDTEVFWQYKNAVDDQTIDSQVWSQAAANTLAAKLGVPAPRVSITTGTPQKIDGMWTIHTKMTLEGVHWKFYSDECFISFTAKALNHYKTSPNETVAFENYPMPLVVDYKVGIKWNKGRTANKGDHTTWTYPEATVNSPAGVKTLLIEFDRSNPDLVIDNRNEIVATGAPAGMNRAFDGQQYLLFTSNTAVNESVIEGFLRNNVQINVYDTDVNPKVLVYINAERNLGTARASRAVTTFMEGFEALSDVPISPMYAGTITIGWSASHFFVGGSAVAHATQMDAGYYQWERNTGTGGYVALAGQTRPTLAITALNSSMNGWQYRLKYGDSPTDPDMKTSNVLRLSFGFTDLAVSGESKAEGTGTSWDDNGSRINIPAAYAPNVTKVSFSWRLDAPANDGDIFYGAYGSSGQFFLNVGRGNASGTRTITLTNANGLSYVYARVYNNATAIAYDATMRVYNVKVSGTGLFEPGSGLVMMRGEHDAWDITSVGFVPEADVIASASSKDKVYDGKEGYATVTLTDRANLLMPAMLEEIFSRGTVVYSSGAVTPANATTGTNCIDVGTYTATFVPAPQDAIYFQSNNAADIAARQTQFGITPRPLYLYSYGNNNPYDGTDFGMIRNIKFRDFKDHNDPDHPDSGVVPSDEGDVAVEPNPCMGKYTGDADPITGEYRMIETEALSLVGTRAHNYYIAEKDFTGARSKAPLYVHSLYQDPGDVPRNPRNIKQYDDTNAAIINDVIIDGIVDGDDVRLNAETYAGTYATSDAGESLTDEGKTQPDRYNNLDENKITRTAPISLVGDDADKYYIASETYSGAIYRRAIDAEVQIRSMLYGDAYNPTFTTAPEYTAAISGQPDYDLWVHTLQGDDILTIDDNLSWFVYDGVDNTTGVGSYPVSYEGLNEANYPMLSNYVVIPHNGAIVIGPREIVVTVDGGYEKIYGDPNPDFEVTYEGFVNGDTPENTLTGDLYFYFAGDEGEKTPVKYNGDGSIGVYVVSARGLEVVEPKNYTIRYVAGDLKVLPAPLIITADDKTRPQRTDNPEWTATYTGLKAGDTPADLEVPPTLTCEADFYSPVGEYPIIVSGAYDGNYDITHVNGTLTIYDGASIDIRKSADKSEVEQYGTITYTIRVENNGERPLYDILIEDFMSEIDGEIVPVESDEYAYIGDGQFTIDFMAIGDVIEIVFKYTTTQFDPGDTTITNNARATESLTDPTDDKPDEWLTDEVEVYIIVNRDIDYDKSTGDVEFAQAGDTIHYTITVTNTGNVPLPNIVVEDDMTVLHSNVNIVSKPDDYTYTVNTLTGHREYRLRELHPGETIVIEYSITLVRQDTDNNITIQNFSLATVPEDDRYPDEDEFIREDDEVIFTGMTELPPIVKTADKVYAEVGEWITYTVVITNNTDETVPYMELQDELSGGNADFADVEIVGDGAVYNGGKHFAITDFAPGESVTITYKYQVTVQITNKESTMNNLVVKNNRYWASNVVSVALPQK